MRLSLRIGQLYLEKYHPQPCPLRLLLPPYRRGQEGGAQAAPAPAFRDDAVQAQQKTVKLGMTLPLTGTPRCGRSWLRDLVFVGARKRA